MGPAAFAIGVMQSLYTCVQCDKLYLSGVLFGEWTHTTSASVSTGMVIRERCFSQVYVSDRTLVSLRCLCGE